MQTGGRVPCHLKEPVCGTRRRTPPVDPRASRGTRRHRDRPRTHLALMLLTGRRECEILNGQSVFTPHTEYSVSFLGQAKKRGAETEYVIPTLAPVDQIVATLASLRDRQQHTVLTNHATSRRYQSYLSRSLTALDPWSECKRVHSSGSVRVHGVPTLRLGRTVGGIRHHVPSGTLVPERVVGLHSLSARRRPCRGTHPWDRTGYGLGVADVDLTGADEFLNRGTSAARRRLLPLSWSAGRQVCGYFGLRDQDGQE